MKTRQRISASFLMTLAGFAGRDTRSRTGDHCGGDGLCVLRSKARMATKPRRKATSLATIGGALVAGAACITGAAILGLAMKTSAAANVKAAAQAMPSAHNMPTLAARAITAPAPPKPKASRKRHAAKTRSRARVRPSVTLALAALAQRPAMRRKNSTISAA